MEKTKKFFGSLVGVLVAIIGVVMVLAVVGVLVWRIFWVTFVDNYELAFSYNKLNGQIALVNRTGWIVRTPFVYSVHAIDLRPYQVTISANARILNAKLVRFNTQGLATFVEWHGRDAGDSTDNMLEILKCYAFDRDEGRDCPFLTVISVLAPNQGAQQTTAIPPTK
jgi:hypothetical protein